jgi:hypothetical protein
VFSPCPRSHPTYILTLPAFSPYLHTHPASVLTLLTHSPCQRSHPTYTLTLPALSLLLQDITLQTTLLHTHPAKQHNTTNHHPAGHLQNTTLFRSRHPSSVQPCTGPNTPHLFNPVQVSTPLICSTLYRSEHVRLSYI